MRERERSKDYLNVETNREETADMAAEEISVVNILREEVEMPKLMGEEWEISCTCTADEGRMVRSKQQKKW